MEYTARGNPLPPPCKLCQLMAYIYQVTLAAAAKIAGLFGAASLFVASIHGDRKRGSTEEADRRFKCLVWIAALILSLAAWAGIIATAVWLLPF